MYQSGGNEQRNSQGPHIAAWVTVNEAPNSLGFVAAVIAAIRRSQTAAYMYLVALGFYVSIPVLKGLSLYILKEEQNAVTIYREDRDSGHNRSRTCFVLLILLK